MTHLVAPSEKCNLSKSKRSAIGTALLSVVLLGTPLILSSCGFHLRGYNTPMTYAAQNTALSLDENDPDSFHLKLPITQRLNAVGVNVVDDIGREINSSDQIYTSSISVDNVRLRRYELVGVLTEVRLVLSADVVYKTLNNVEGETTDPIVVKNKVQVERTYQYNEASVSTDDRQGENVQDWLYQNLAQRIADQYVALNLPRVAPKKQPVDSDDVSVVVPADINKTLSESSP